MHSRLIHVHADNALLFSVHKTSSWYQYTCIHMTDIRTHHNRCLEGTTVQCLFRRSSSQCISSKTTGHNHEGNFKFYSPCLRSSILICFVSSLPLSSPSIQSFPLLVVTASWHVAGQYVQSTIRLVGSSQLEHW